MVPAQMGRPHATPSLKELVPIVIAAAIWGGVGDRVRHYWYNAITLWW